MFQTTVDFYSDPSSADVSLNEMVAHITERRSSSKMALIEFFLFSKKRLDCLHGLEKTYQEKVTLLIQFWKLLAHFQPAAADEGFNPNTFITQRLYMDTLQLILHGDWSHLPQMYNSNLIFNLNKATDNLNKSSSAYQICQQLIQLVETTPWENTTLKKIVNGEQIDGDEAMSFCIEEKETLLNLRLETLCASRDCLEMALKLVKVYRQCLTNSDARFLETCSEEMKEHWLDVHLALTYQYDRDEFFQLIKQLADDVACQLVKRFTERRGERKGLWRKSLNIAELTSKSLLTHALGVWPPSSMMIQFMAIQLFDLQKCLGKKAEHLISMLQTMMDGNNFLTSKHMYHLCHALSVKEELKSFCIELYARAVAVDLNHLEKWKQSASTNTVDAERVKTTEMDLAKEFSSLTELVESNTLVARECALTAFSLAPTPERYAKVETLQLAAEKVLREIGDTQPYSEAAAKGLGITNSVIKDLSVVVHSCRWEVLTWKSDWSSLFQEYLADPEKKRSVTTDLNFLNSKLDYSQFDHLPKPEVDLFTGIEKGYENYVHDIDIAAYLPVVGPVSKRKKTYHQKLALRKSFHLVKKLRRMRPFSGGRNQLCKATPCEDVQQQKWPLTSFVSPFCSPTLDHFAPMLSTLNMFPKVTLTRIPINFSGPSPVLSISVVRDCSELLSDDKARAMQNEVKEPSVKIIASPNHEQT